MCPGLWGTATGLAQVRSLLGGGSELRGGLQVAPRPFWGRPLPATVSRAQRQQRVRVSVLGLQDQGTSQLPGSCCVTWAACSLSLFEPPSPVTASGQQTPSRTVARRGTMQSALSFAPESVTTCVTRALSPGPHCALSVDTRLCHSVHLAMSLHVSVSLCISLSISFCLCVSLCIYFLCLSFSLSLSLFLYLLLSLSLPISLYLSISYSLSPSLSLSLSVSLSSHISLAGSQVSPLLSPPPASVFLSTPVSGCLPRPVSETPMASSLPAVELTSTPNPAIHARPVRPARFSGAPHAPPSAFWYMPLP